MTRAPGVYIQEVPSGPRPIRAVGTSTAAFLGVAPRAQARVGEAIPITSWTRFLQIYTSDREKTGTPFSQAIYAFFANGGTRCYALNIGLDHSLGAHLKTLESLDEIAIVAAPGATDAASHEALIAHCEQMKDRMAICDLPPHVDDLDDLKTVAALGDGAGKGLRPRASAYGTAYFPWILVQDPLSGDDPVAIPPSGGVAGVWARVDAMRGVHKAPANEAIRGALGLSLQVTRADHGSLNEAGINCIRSFPAEGIRIYGARTLAESASEWTYLSVRRLFNMIEESIQNGTRWLVFEPNDRTLWQHARRDVTAFLMGLWRDGALMGRTPEEAFFVQCDEETNPKSEIDKGVVTIRVGICPVRPAEFVVFQISQYEGGSQSAAETA